MTSRLTLAACALAAALAAGCSSDTSTPVSPTTRLTSFSFNSTFLANGSATRSFEQVSPGSVAMTLSATSPSVALSIGIGIPRVDGSGCNLTRTITTLPGSSPQLTVTAESGNWCVRVADAGTVTDKVTFTLDVKHN